MLKFKNFKANKIKTFKSFSPFQNLIRKLIKNLQKS